jgi:hypothetical protein
LLKNKFPSLTHVMSDNKNEEASKKEEERRKKSMKGKQA